MSPSEKERLAHMHELAREAIAFTANKTLDEVKSDRVLSLALVHLVESSARRLLT